MNNISRDSAFLIILQKKSCTSIAMEVNGYLIIYTTALLKIYLPALEFSSHFILNSCNKCIYSALISSQ